MSKFIPLLIALLACLNVAEAGTGAWPKGPDVYIMKPNLLFQGGDVKIMTGDTDSPTVVAKDADEGTAYIQNGTGTWFNKTDTGTTVNWQLFIQGALALSGLDNCVPRWDGVGSGVLQDSLLCIDDAGVGIGLTGLFVDGDGHFDELHVGGASQSATAGLNFEVEDDSNNSILQVTDSGNVVLTSPSASKPLQLDGSNVVYSGDINATTDIDGILPVEHGGSGLDASSASNGQILIGNGTGFTLNVVSGTANQVIMTPSAGGITLSAPQDIHAGATPTFVSATFTGLLPNQFIKTDGTSALSSSATIDLASEVSGILPQANGGIGFDGTTATDGQLLIGSTGVGFVSASLTGTLNQVIVSPSAGGIALELPQDIHTGATPAFVSASFSGLTPNQLVVTDGASGLQSSELLGTIDQISVTSGVGTTTLSLPQDIATTSSPSFTTVIASDTDVGAVFFGGPQKEIDSDVENLFWDDANDVLNIGTSTSVTNTILNLDSTSKALLVPRLTTAQKNAISPSASGMVLYDTDIEELQYYSSSSWKGALAGTSEPEGCVISHTRNAATNSGSCSSGAYTTPLWNASESYCATMGITLSASQVTIANAGNYMFDCTITAYASVGIRSALYDITGTSYLNYGSWGFTSGSANGATSRLSHRVVQGGTNNVYEVRSYCDTSAGANDFGTWGSDGITPSRFSQCIIWKVK